MHTLQSMFGITLPVVQAPMAGVQDDALAIAVAQAGGLGSLPCALLSPARLELALQRFASIPTPINLNFFCHTMTAPDAAQQQHWRTLLAAFHEALGIDPPVPGDTGVRRPIDDATVDLLGAFRPKVLSFHFGLPAPELLARLKAWGATVLASATTVEEGRWLQQSGADIVIAQGIEAGGHRGHFLAADLADQLPTHVLVAALSRTLTVPVIAAGGIGDRADATRLLAAGASAVQAGTAYMLCPEATTAPVHRAALMQGDRPTAITNLFTGRPARGIVNRLMRELGPLSDAAPAFPWAAQALSGLRAHAEARGLDDFTPLWSGTRPGTFRTQDAAAVTRALAGVG